MDARLKFIAELARQDGDYTVVDCGCDHGKVLYYLLAANDRCSAIAIDRSAPSLNKAKELLLGWVDRVRFYCADGLDCLGDVRLDTLIISGIGGRNMVEILSRAKARFGRLILSPHRDVDYVAEWLGNNGYTLERTHKLECKRKHYVVLEAA